MGLFSKPKVPGLDVAALRLMNQQTLQKQKDLAAQREAGLQPLSQQFEEKRKALSAQIEPGAEKLIGQYGQELSGVGQREKEQADIAGKLFREQQFRDVPAIQQAIRNQLSGSRLMGSGAALSSLAKPTLQAAQQSADFAAKQEADRLANLTRRGEALATTGFNARQQAMADRLGIDQSTMDYLTQIGRTDLIDKFNTLAGAEEQYGSNEMAIEMARQQTEMAKAQAAAQRKGAIMSTLGTLAGMGAGAMIGAPHGGAALGSVIGGQAGGALGGMAGGQVPQQIDPTLLYALMQQKTAKKNIASPTIPG
jgi:hypothetical protein